MKHDATLWDRVDEVILRAPSISAMRFHRLHLLAASLHRRLGIAVDPQLAASERAAVLQSMIAPVVLRRIRSVVDGPLVVMKGPEAAASYLEPDSRPYGDLDILTRDVATAHSALVTHGFIEVPGCSSPYHERPLALPGLPLVIELHWAPHFLPGLAEPPFDALMALTQPSLTGIPGLDGFVPAAHAVLLAVHAWAHGPLEMVGQLIDIAAVLADADRRDADAIARAWGCFRLWHTTTNAIDAVLAGERASVPLRTWARHLPAVREPRVIESYLARVVAPAWALPGRRSLGGVGAEMLRTARPAAHESWRDQLPRSRRAITNFARPLSHHRAHDGG